MVQVSGISLHVEDHGSGKPVLLLHGWPDSAYLWRNQIPFLVNSGFHAIAPDLRGFGRSDRPEGVGAYSLQNAVCDLVGILDRFSIDAADIVRASALYAHSQLDAVPKNDVGACWSERSQYVASRRNR